MIKDDRTRVHRVAQIPQLLDLSLAHVGAGFWSISALFDLADDDRARLDREFAQFAERISLVVG